MQLVGGSSRRAADTRYDRGRKYKVLPPRQGPVHERLLLAAGGVEYVVDDRAEHLAHLDAGFRQGLRQRRREGTVRSVAVGRYGPSLAE
jgi:hypothetical protein